MIKTTQHIIKLDQSSHQQLPELCQSLFMLAELVDIVNAKPVVVRPKSWLDISNGPFFKIIIAFFFKFRAV